MEEKKKKTNPKLPIIVGSIASVIKPDQILHQQLVWAGQKTFLLKLQKFLSRSSLPQSCRDIPKHGLQFKAIIVVKYLGYHQGLHCGGLEAASVFSPPFFFSTSYSELPLLGGIWVVCIGCVYISCTPVLCVKSWATKFMLYSCITDKCFEKSGITEISWKFKQQQMRSCEGLTGYCVDWHKQEFSIQNPGMCWIGRTHQNH